MDERAEYWIEIADYEIETAKAMLQTGRYLYVGFMCHQTIEKGWCFRKYDGYFADAFKDRQSAAS